MVELPPEGNLVKNVQGGFAEEFANVVCLQMRTLVLVCSYAGRISAVCFSLP